MTNEQINAAIHAALGNPKSCKTPKSCQACCCDKCLYNKGLNYCSDLNAMHEAEKNMCKQEFFVYLRKLPIGPDSITATAHQRAEAFLRTLGKWEEA